MYLTFYINFLKNKYMVYNALLLSCSKHKGAEQIQPLSEEFAKSEGPVLMHHLFVGKKTNYCLRKMYVRNTIKGVIALGNSRRLQMS